MNHSYSYSSDIWPALVTFVLVSYLGWYSWQRRDIPAAKPFIVACLFGGLWTLGAVLELSAVQFSSKVFWLKFQAIWHLPVATAITCFVLQYAGLDRWLNLPTYAFLSIAPLSCMLAMVTNEAHHLIWTGFRMKEHVVVFPGELYWIFNVYGSLLALFNFAVLIQLGIRSRAHLRPVAIIVSGQMIARAGYLLDKIYPEVLGPGESALLIVGVVSVAYAVAFFRFDAIDPVGAARKAVLQQMREGMFVVDLQGLIREANPAGAAILGIGRNRLRNRPLAEVMPMDAAILGLADEEGAGQTDILLGEGNSARYYNLNLMVLRGRRGEWIGWLILLHDVTEQKHSQIEILRQESVVATLQERERLARELHDGIGQTLGYVGMQAQTAVKWLQEGSVAKAESILARLVDVARDAHADVRESILNLRTGSGEEGAFIPALEKYVERFQQNYGIQTELTVGGGIGENPFDPAAGVQLLRVIQEALTNCRKHSGASSSRIRVELNGGGADITIADDGNGFEAGGFERGDGDHFGLIFMRERLEQIGGHLTIDSVPGGGTTLKLNVPIREERKERT